RETNHRVYHIRNDRYFRHPVSPTFHGRDVFAPVAARIALGLDPEELGEKIKDYVRFEIPRPRLINQPGLIEGHLIHIDHFGNCVTNFSEVDLKIDQLGPLTKLYFAGREISRFKAFFAESMDQDELFAYPGSAGYWEIALWRRSAAKFVDAKRG